MSDFLDWTGNQVSSIWGVQHEVDNSATVRNMALDVQQYGAETAGSLFAGAAGGKMTPDYLQRHYDELDTQATQNREADNAAAAQREKAERDRVLRR